MTPKEYLSRYRDLGQSIDAKRAQLQRLREQAVQITPVSYTHLTLPTT